MNSNFKLNLSGAIFFMLLFFILLTIGYFFGNTLGNNIITEYLGNRKGAIYTIYRPAARYLTINRLMNSNNSLERLSAYYSLLDNDMIEIEFLYERYKKEKLPAIKQTIIWILSFSKKIENVKVVFNEIYKDAGVIVKKEILRSLKRIDHKYFEEFKKDNNVDDYLLEGI